MTNKDLNISAKIEALLFVHGKEMDIKRLAKIIGVSEDEIKKGIDDFSNKLNSPDSGLSLMFNGDKVMLATKPELSELVKNLVSDELDSNLTPATLETLSLIAYLGPVSKAEIEYIRGVNSSFILRNLLIRGLINKSVDKSSASTYIYNVTFDFLRHVGVGSQEELPEFEKYRDLIRAKSNEDEKENENTEGSTTEGAEEESEPKHND